MIEKLTKEQEALLPVYADKYIALGKSTKPLPENKAELIAKINKTYECGGLTPPKTVLFFNNPTEMLLFAKKHGDPTPTSNLCYGSLEANWIGFYEFFRQELKLTGLESIEGLSSLTGEASVFKPYGTVCLVSQNPTSIYTNAKGLHNMNAPALEYATGADGSEFKLYYINGVEVPDWVVTTPAADLDAKKILKITNVDVRREALRKMGPENLIKQLKGKTLDKVAITKDNMADFGYTNLRKDGMAYKLVELDIGDDFKVKYLQMSNPSLEHEHLEGVPNDCQTVKDALAFRNQQALAALGIQQWQAPKELT